MLGFAELHEDQLDLSPAGKVFAGASIQDSKEIFARASLDRAPLVRTIYRALRGSLDGTLPAGFFTDILRTSFSEEESATQFDIAINWGRYAELYAFDSERDEVTREEQGIGATLAEEEPRGRHPVGAARRGPRLGQDVHHAARGPGAALPRARTWSSASPTPAAGRAPSRPSAAWRPSPPLARGTPAPRTHGHRRPAGPQARRGAGRRPRPARGAIAALRDAGIDVISTADVSDVQRAAEAVEAITGHPPPATISDQVLDTADAVQFVDSSPEALRKRLGHGNIYPPGQVQEALATDFETPRLAALREVGLRLVAGTLPAPGARGSGSRRTSWSQ